MTKVRKRKCNSFVIVIVIVLWPNLDYLSDYPQSTTLSTSALFVTNKKYTDLKYQICHLIYAILYVYQIVIVKWADFPSDYLKLRAHSKFRQIPKNRSSQIPT